MDRALVKLLRLRFRGGLRQVFRGVKTPRGAIFFALGMLVFVLWLGPAFFMAAMSHQRSDPEAVRAIVPLALLGICLMTVLTAGRQKSIYFSPAEVDFLFGGPFSRRELLAYKLSGGGAASLATALFFSVLFLRHATFWIAAFLGCFLAFVFIQLFSTAVVLIGQTVAEHAYTRARRLVLLAILVLAAVAIGPAISVALEQGLLPFAEAMRNSTIGFCFLAPFEVFGRTIAAERLAPDLIVWASLAMAVDLALFVLVMRLDVNYLEAALAVSQKLYQRKQQARRRGAAWVTQSSAGWRLPRFPWLGGAGPIARKQLTTALRSARGFLIFFLVVGAIVGVNMVSLKTAQGAGLGALGGQILFLTIIFARTLPFDFRGDLDYMDWLKSLPLGSTAIAAGQLVAPTTVMTLIHLVLLGVVAVFVQQSATVLLVLILFVPPFNWLLFGLENLFFLLFPARMQAATPGDLQHIGRTMVELFVKMFSLVACCGVAAGLGGLAYLVCGGSWIASVAAGWLALATLAAMVVPCIAWAYRKFDVSVDTPA